MDEVGQLGTKLQWKNVGGGRGVRTTLGYVRSAEQGSLRSNRVSSDRYEISRSSWPPKARGFVFRQPTCLFLSRSDARADRF